jgi:transcriptional regulator with XRE-family HTH domain
MEISPPNETDQAIAARLRRLRLARGMTLDDLARASGVSRAMISRIEREESSPTATLLARLAAPLGISLAELFSTEQAPQPLLRRSEQSVWRDPATGYTRRNLSSMGPGVPIGLVEVVLPPGAHVLFDQHPRPFHFQLVHVLEGALEATVGEDRHLLAAGDCLSMRLDRPNQYRNSSDRDVRYLIAITSPDGRHPGE